MALTSSDVGQVANSESSFFQREGKGMSPAWHGAPVPWSSWSKAWMNCPFLFPTAGEQGEELTRIPMAESQRLILYVPPWTRRKDDGGRGISLHCHEAYCRSLPAFSCPVCWGREMLGKGRRCGSPCPGKPGEHICRLSAVRGIGRFK